MNLIRKNIAGIISIVLLLLIISSCKKDINDSTTVSNEDANKIATILNVSNAALLQYQTSLQSGHDSIDALIDMGKWIIQQQEVSKAFIVDFGMVQIQFKSGLNSYIKISRTDANGLSLWRGGSGAATNNSAPVHLKNQLRNSSGDYLIENKDVLIFSPYNKEFYHDNYPFMAKFTQGDIKLNPTLVKDEDADLSVIDNFKNYGFIIINSHGLINGFSIKNKVKELSLPRAVINAEHYDEDDILGLFIEINDLPIRKFLTGDLEMIVLGFVQDATNNIYTSNSTLVTDKYIRKLPELDKAVVFGNYCYSGWTFQGADSNNVSQAFKSIGAVSYFGYSYPDGNSGSVDTTFAIQMEDSLISNLVINKDSTGIAHLDNNISIQGNSTFYYHLREPVEVKPTLSHGGLMFHAPPPGIPLEFQLFFDPRYKYESCGSFTDIRDGNVYQLACIGNQTWFAENLRYNIGKNYIYNNQPSNLAKYGRLYTYGAVSAGMGIGSPSQPGLQGICPQGWHIPSESEINELYSVLATNSSSQDYGIQIKAATLWDEPIQDLTSPLRNKVKLNIYPSGTASEYSNGTFLSFYEFEQANIWLSSNLVLNPPLNSVGVWEITNAGMPTLYHQVLGVNNSADFSYHSCRCLQD